MSLIVACAVWYVIKKNITTSPDIWRQEDYHERLNKVADSQGKALRSRPRRRPRPRIRPRGDWSSGVMSDGMMAFRWGEGAFWRAELAPPVLNSPVLAGRDTDGDPKGCSRTAGETATQRNLTSNSRNSRDLNS